MNPYLICNWKTYLISEREAVSLAEKLAEPSGVTAAVCPSSLHLGAVSGILEKKNIAAGAQDIGVSAEAPQTGRLSGGQIRAAGGRYVLVGHAETRRNGVTNAMVAEKAHHAHSAHLVPVICLSGSGGGMSEEDEAAAQLEELLTESFDAVKHGILAYEPSDRIGAEEALPAKHIRRIALRLREAAGDHGAAVPVLYGGSVNADTASDCVVRGGVDGLLLGRAGTDAESVNTILHALAVLSV